tara:strand:- start:150 stop:392 length:243 start_codon:yes stop_codon:yes gene_type:complete
VKVDMKDLVEYIAKSIASKPDEVTVTAETNDEDVTLIKLEVAPEDKGKVIGRQGRVAQSIRLLLRVAAVKNGTRAMLEIL